MTPVQPSTIEPQQPAIRPYRPADRDAVYAICLGTGDAGGDASALYRDPELIGHVYAGPYLALEPDLCFVLAERHRVLGYVLGTRDSLRFGQSCERDWFAPLRRRYPAPADAEAGRDARMKRLIHAGYRADPELAAWPAHLHIDLLPAVQGRGWGTRLLQRFLGRLGELDAAGVHALTGPANPRAMAFYGQSGFAPVKASAGTIAYAMSLRRDEPWQNPRLSG
jgi:GNAT superfamily N-acetyltransferase